MLLVVLSDSTLATRVLARNPKELHAGFGAESLGIQNKASERKFRENRKLSTRLVG